MQVVAKTSSIRLTPSGLTKGRPLLSVHHSTCPNNETATELGNLLPFKPGTISSSTRAISQASG
jgi:hypothetical protein